MIALAALDSAVSFCALAIDTLHSPRGLAPDVADHAASDIRSALEEIGGVAVPRPVRADADWRRAQGLLAHALTALHRARICAAAPALPGVALGYVREAAGCLRDALDALCEVSP